jgi:signal peptidase II
MWGISGLRPGLALAAVVVLIDQVTKLWAERTLTLYAPVEITSFFNLTWSTTPVRHSVF